MCACGCGRIRFPWLHLSAWRVPRVKADARPSHRWAPAWCLSLYLLPAPAPRLVASLRLLIRVFIFLTSFPLRVEDH